MLWWLILVGGGEPSTIATPAEHVPNYQQHGYNKWRLMQWGGKYNPNRR